MFTSPAYQGDSTLPCPSGNSSSPWANCGVKQLKALSAQYDTALANSRRLQEERDALGQKYQALSPASVARLTKLLPDNADNIRLVIDIQRMAQTYGMSLASIKFDSSQLPAQAASGSLAAAAPSDVADASKDYGTFNLEFQTTATYANFLSFLKDMESSLRLADISAVAFSAGGDPSKNTYTYTIRLKTYWLK